MVDAHARGDEPRLRRLLSDYRDDITRQCLDWTTAKHLDSDDREALNRYINALGWLAKTLEKQGDPRLWRKLAPDDAKDNPIVHWEQAIEQSQKLADALEYDRAIALLEDVLINNRGLKGPAMDRYVPITHGALGHFCFQSARLELAQGHYETALRLCREFGDREGTCVYCKALYELYRYRGDGARAAEYAEQAAEALLADAKADDAAEMRRHAAIARAGEPLLRMVAVMNGRTYELDDFSMGEVRNVKVQFNFVRNRMTLRKATVLDERGRRLGTAGKYWEALAEFRAAAEADPFDPQSRYDEAFSLMHLERHGEAAEAYAAVERLAPGWFHCRSDGLVAREIASGRWPHPAFLALTLEDAAAMKPVEKLRIVDHALTLAPDLAGLHLLRGNTLKSADRDEEAAAAYEAGIACAGDDHDAHNRLLVQLSLAITDLRRRRDLLTRAAAMKSSGNLMAATFAQVALASMKFD